MTTVFWSILALRSSFCCWRTWIFSSRIMFFSAYKRRSVKRFSARLLGFGCQEQCLADCSLRCLSDYRIKSEGCEQPVSFKQNRTENTRVQTIRSNKTIIVTHILDINIFLPLLCTCVRTSGSRVEYISRGECPCCQRGAANTAGT